MVWPLLLPTTQLKTLLPIQTCTTFFSPSEVVKLVSDRALLPEKTVTLFILFSSMVDVVTILPLVIRVSVFFSGAFLAQPIATIRAKKPIIIILFILSSHLIKRFDYPNNTNILPAVNE